MRKTTIARKVIIGSAAASLIGLSVAAPLVAHAADGPNTVTFTLDSNGIAVTQVTDPVSLTATAQKVGATGGTQVQGQLGTIAVIDDRGDATSNWQSSVVTTPFVNAHKTLPVTAVTYSTGNVSVDSLTPSNPITPATFAVGPEGIAPNSAALDLQTATALPGNNSASWAPTITVALPAYGQVSGDYTATITHSVA